MEYTDVKSQVEYGLEKVDPNRKIEVSLKDFLYLQGVLWEFVRFFHQPLHYETLEDVERFLGDDKNEGAFHLLKQVFYQKFHYEDILPEDIIQMIHDGEFNNPIPSYYYEP